MDQSGTDQRSKGSPKCPGVNGHPRPEACAVDEGDGPFVKTLIDTSFKVQV